MGDQQGGREKRSCRMFRDDKDEINVTTLGGKANAHPTIVFGYVRGRDYYDLIKLARQISPQRIVSWTTELERPRERSQ